MIAQTTFKSSYISWVSAQTITPFRQIMPSGGQTFEKKRPYLTNWLNEVQRVALAFHGGTKQLNGLHKVTQAIRSRDEAR